MDGGLAIFGFGLFLFSIANLYSRSAYGLAWVLLALSLASMGLAFSESKNLRNFSLGMSGALVVAAIVSAIAGVVWWQWLGTFAFAVAYGLLWAEFRFPAFGNVRTEDVPHHEPGRWRIHLPHRRQRV